VGSSCFGGRGGGEAGGGGRSSHVCGTPSSSSPSSIPLGDGVDVVDAVWGAVASDATEGVADELARSASL